MLRASAGTDTAFPGMDRVRSKSHQQADAHHGRPRLVVIEPDGLTRWAVERYLSRWFAVSSVANPSEAEIELGAELPAAVIVSDDLPDGVSVSLETAARQANPQAIVVHTTTESARRVRNSDALRIEKPFDLAQLARLLGVDAE